MKSNRDNYPQTNKASLLHFISKKSTKAGIPEIWINYEERLEICSAFENGTKYCHYDRTRLHYDEFVNVKIEQIPRPDDYYSFIVTINNTVVSKSEVIAKDLSRYEDVIVYASNPNDTAAGALIKNFEFTNLNEGKKYTRSKI